MWKRPIFCTSGRRSDAVRRQAAEHRSRHRDAAEARRFGARAAVAAVFLCLTGGDHAPDHDLRQQFQAAQRAFDSADSPQDFLRVAAAYQAILDRGFVSAAVLYNQGNAFLRAEQYGRAIAVYRQAQRYWPRDGRVQHNLRLALAACDPTAGDELPGEMISSPFWMWQNRVSYREKFLLLAIVGGVAFTIAVVRLFRPGRGRALFAVALGVMLLLGASAAFDFVRFQWMQHGVVISDGTIARHGNSEAYEPAMNKALSEGTEFRVLEQRSRWLAIETADGQRGWIPANQAVVY